MKQFLRYFGATVFISLAVGSFALFEYWKLLETDSRYLGAAAFSAVSLYVSLIFFFSFDKALYVVLALSVAEFGFLKWKSQSELNQVLSEKGRCESLLVDWFGPRFDRVLIQAQNACTFRIFQRVLSQEPAREGEAKILVVAKLMAAEDRLDETSLVLLLSADASLESKRSEQISGHRPADSLKDEFSLIENAISILEIYQVKPLFAGQTFSNMEVPRMQKLLEISTLGKTLGVFMARARDALDSLASLSQLSAKGMSLESGELTLLGVRAQKMKEGLNHVISLWDLSGHLGSLNLKDTYPEQYEKVLKEVTLEAL